MDMRLGKSLTTIRWLEQRVARRVLLIAPSAPLLDWADELKLERIPTKALTGSRKARNYVLGEAQVGFDGWVYCTYQTALATPGIRDVGWDAVVLDESTAIKNPKAKITKQLLKWCANVPYRVVLSGLPTPQDYMNIFCQMAWVQGGTFMGFANYWKWREALFYQAGFDWRPKKGVLERIKAAVHQQSVIMSWEDAGLNLKLEHRTEYGELSKEARALQDELLKTWAIDGMETKVAAVIAGRMHQLAGGFGPGGAVDCWKYAAVRDLVMDKYAGQKLVVWCAYTNEIMRLAHGRDWLTLCGATKKDIRPDVLRDFRLPHGPRVLIANPALARYGLDLSCADVAIYFSCSYSFEARRQSERRITHPRKTRPGLIIDLVTRDSADEAVQDALRDRRSDAAYFMSRVFTRLRSK